VRFIYVLISFRLFPLHSHVSTLLVPACLFVCLFASLIASATPDLHTLELSLISFLMVALLSHPCVHYST